MSDDMKYSDDYDIGWEKWIDAYDQTLQDMTEEDFDDEDGLNAEETDETDVVFGTGPITQPSMIKFMHQYPDSVLKFLLRRNLDGRPLPGEFEKIYDQWQQRGLMRGRLKRHLLKMMEWEEIPDTPVHELVGQIRNRILDLRLEQDSLTGKEPCRWNRC